MSSISELQYHKEASEEVRSAYLWYAERDQKPARLFSGEINLAIEKIRRSPKRWPQYDRSVLRGFPFQIIYYLDAAGYIRAGCRPHAETAGYWRYRK